MILVATALQSLRTVIQSCIEFFIQILYQTGGLKIWYNAILITVVYRFIFAPVFGHAKSDLSSKSYNLFKRRKGE